MGEDFGSDYTCHLTAKGWEGGAEKQGRGCSENLSGKSISLSLPVWVSPTACCHLAVSGLQVSHSTTLLLFGV